MRSYCRWTLAHPVVILLPSVQRRTSADALRSRRLSLVGMSRQRLQLATLAALVATGSLAGTLFTASLPLYLADEKGYSLGLVGGLVGIAFVPQILAPVFIGSPVYCRGWRIAALCGT